MFGSQEDVPSFGQTEAENGANFGKDSPTFSVPPIAAGTHLGSANGVAASGLDVPQKGTEEDELNYAASTDKVQEAAEQIAEFLMNFSQPEQCAILAPFMTDEGLRSFDASPQLPIEPHISEAQQFVWDYLMFYSESERALVMRTWRSVRDTASLSTTVESLTPPGSVTPTAVTPREFLSARRARSITPTGRERAVSTVINFSDTDGH